MDRPIVSFDMFYVNLQRKAIFVALGYIYEVIE